MTNKNYMKKIWVVLGILVSIAAVHVVRAQNSEGVITYEVKVNLHRRLPPGSEQMKTMIPEFRTTKQQLIFNAAESLYKPIIEDEEEDTQASSGGMQIRMRVPMDEIFIDPATSGVSSKREFMGKDYLIEDTLKMSAWKFGEETKVIQGYTCKQAYFTDNSIPDRVQEITAWYTDQLRPMLGPERFGTLPGAVLAVDVNNGERVIVARQIDFRALKKNELKRPANGVKISNAAYRKMVDEQMQKMRANGGVVIRN